MNPTFRLLVILTICAGFIAPLARGQAVLGGTDYGKSQNTAQDLANSLTPGKPNLTKGEKKSEVDPKTLPSKKAPKDPLFSGGLNDIGVDWDGSKMAKLQGSQGANSGEPSGNSATSKSAKQTDVAADKGPKTGATDDKVSSNSELSSSSSEVAKAQKADASKSDEKPAEKEKAAAAKPDGDH
jgi:hypothetical protein